MKKLLIVVVVLIQVGCTLPEWMLNGSHGYAPGGGCEYINWQTEYKYSVERAERDLLLRKLKER